MAAEPDTADVLAEARRYLEGHDVVTLATLDDAGVWVAPVRWVRDTVRDVRALGQGEKPCVPATPR